MNPFKRQRSKDKKPATTKDYEALGRQVEAMYEAINPDRNAVYRTSFFKGVFAGVGGVIGATLVVALLLWVLSLFSQLPFVGDYSEAIQNTIEEDAR